METGIIAAIVVVSLFVFACLLVGGFFFFFFYVRPRLGKSSGSEEKTTYANLDNVEVNLAPLEYGGSKYTAGSKESTAGIAVPSKAEQPPIAQQAGAKPAPDRRLSIHTSQNINVEISGRASEIVEEKKKAKEKRLAKLQTQRAPSKREKANSAKSKSNAASKSETTDQQSVTKKTEAKETIKTEKSGDKSNASSKSDDDGKKKANKLKSGDKSGDK